MADDSGMVGLSRGSSTLDHKTDPSRRCLKRPNWPDADQAAWEVAVTSGGLLDEKGLAAHWRPATCKSVQDAYGRWLTHLERSGELDPDVAPAARLTPERLIAFVTELQATVAPLTVRNRIRDLAEALRVMGPEADFSYLKRARARLKARARPIRNKRAQMVHSRDLVQLGKALMTRAENGQIARSLWRAALFRDGLMILMLACRPIRRKSFAGLRLGQHLVKRGDVYVLLLEEGETKNCRRLEQPYSATLTPFIERYLKYFRPELLGNGNDTEGYLWISWRGEPVAETGVYTSITGRTRAAFGTAIPPHRFRDSAVTSLSETDPELVWLAPVLLHHADLRIAEAHYNQARDSQAVELWQRHVLEWREATKRNSRMLNK